MALKIDLRKIAADALDMAITPDNVSTLSKHDKQYHPDGYEEGQFCKFRQAMERGDSADKLDAAEQEEAATKAEVARLVKRLEDVGRLILTAPEDEEKYAAILDSYGFKKGDADYQKAYDTIYNAAEAYDAMGDEGGDAVGELKAAVLRVDEALSTMKQPKKTATGGAGVATGSSGSIKPSASASQDRDDLYEIREYLEKCARLLNGRAGNVAAIQASGRWPLLQEVSGGKLGKEIGDRLDEMAKGGDAAVQKAVGLLKPVYDKIVQSSKNGWTVKPGMIVGEEELFEDNDAEDESLEEHDRKYHGGHFDPKTQSCGKREAMANKDKEDMIQKKNPRDEYEDDDIEDAIYEAFGDEIRGAGYVKDEGDAYRVSGYVVNESDKMKSENLMRGIAKRFNCESGEFKWQVEKVARGGILHNFTSIFKKN